MDWEDGRKVPWSYTDDGKKQGMVSRELMTKIEITQFVHTRCQLSARVVFPWEGKSPYHFEATALHLFRSSYCDHPHAVIPGTTYLASPMDPTLSYRERDKNSPR